MADEVQRENLETFKNVPLDDEEDNIQEQKPKEALLRRILNFIIKNYLPLSLIFLVFFGILVPAPGAFLARFPSHYVCIVGLFLHSGIKLRTGEIKEAFRAYRALLIQMVIILFLTPVIGVSLTGLLPFGGTGLKQSHSKNTTNITQHLGNGTSEQSSEISLLGPESFRVGVQMYFVVPCTISAGVVLVDNAGGNAALALMTTVICNLTAVFTVPLLIKWLMSFEGVSIDVVNLLIKLILTVLVPLLVGKGMRYIPKVKPFVKKYSTCLKLSSITLLVAIPWMKVSVSSQQGAFGKISAASIFAILGWGLAVHFAFMIMNLVFSLICRIDMAALKCIVILASQKSLSVAITVMALLPFSVVEQGIMALPMVIIHLGILLIDAVIVSIWHNIELRRQKARETTTQLNGEVILNENTQL